MSVDLVKYVDKSILLTELGISKLHPDVYFIDGMSSSKVRRLLNSLCELPDCVYAEVGSWKGSSLISALYNNHDIMKLAIAIDNFSEFQEPLFTNSLNFEGSPIQHKTIKLSLDPIPIQFKNNIDTYLGVAWNDKLDIYNNDCFAVSLLEELRQKYTNSVNIYFYDGAHDEQSQYNGIIKYDFLLTNQFILIVDDWNDGNAKEGTMKAINDLKYKIVRGWELPASFNGDVWNYWNGILIAIMEK